MNTQTVPELLETLIRSSGSVWIGKSVLEDEAHKKNIGLSSIPLLCSNGRVKNMTIGDRTCYSLARYDALETHVAYHAVRILRNYICPPDITEKRLTELLSQFEIETGSSLHECQKKAVYTALTKGLAVISGGPGTGKTYLLKALVYALRRCIPGVDIRFTAPTGKAARRITESTQNPAKTIQKELGICPGNSELKMFGGDVLIIDEVSMLDMETAFYVLNALQNGQKLILTGDIDQLPSVGPGAVLRDLLFSGTIPAIFLTKTFRQSDSSNLYCNIRKIKNGDCNLSNGPDFHIVPVKTESALQMLIPFFLHEVKKYGSGNVACLLPYRKAGILCSDHVNNILQSIINPVKNKPFLKFITEPGREVLFTVGDPVMQLENRTECANGDTGFIISVKSDSLVVKYHDTCVKYDADSLHQLSLAYAISISKAQGSEYRSVIICITSAHSALLSRNLIYTAITRATEHCTLLQEYSAIKQPVTNEITYGRETFLAEKIKYYNLKAAFLSA